MFGSDIDNAIQEGYVKTKQNSKTDETTIGLTDKGEIALGLLEKWHVDEKLGLVQKSIQISSPYEVVVVNTKLIENGYVKLRYPDDIQKTEINITEKGKKLADCLNSFS